MLSVMLICTGVLSVKGPSLELSACIQQQVKHKMLHTYHTDVASCLDSTEALFQWLPGVS